MSPWSTTAFSAVFGESVASNGTRRPASIALKELTWVQPIEIIVENQLIIGLTTMKFLLFISFAVGLLVLERPIICGETFTEGVRVSPETVTLKPGEYVWEPERAPEGPLLIVASITEQVAYVYRNGVRIARSSVSTGRPGHRTPLPRHPPGRSRAA